MDGYRVLESGDSRVIESGATRVTEGFVEDLLAEAQLNGSGTITPVGELIKRIASNLSGSGSVYTQADVVILASSNLSGVGSQSSSGYALRPLSVALSGSSVLVPTSTKIKYLVSNFSGAGSTVIVSRRIGSGSYTSVSEEATRITEAGNTRITENGNTRITDPLIYNQGEGNLVATASLIKFFAIAYIKVSGVWEKVKPSANYQGVWKLLPKIYKNISENWKRIY